MSWVLMGQDAGRKRKVIKQDKLSKKDRKYLWRRTCEAVGLRTERWEVGSGRVCSQAVWAGRHTWEGTTFLGNEEALAGPLLAIIW